MTYLRRHADERLARLLDIHPACLIEGVRGAGKTRSAERIAATTLRLDHPPTAEQMAADPESVCAGLPTPILIDEWQRVPQVWDAVRRMVDQDRTPGRFILSGSSRSAVNADIHTGAGRILPLRLRPMTLSERRGEAPVVALADVAAHGIEAVRGARSPLSPAEQIATTAESGLPGYLNMEQADHHEALRAYLDLAVARDLAEITSTMRNTSKLRNYLRTYGAVISTTADHASIYQAAGVSKATGETYHDVLSRIGLIEELPGWSHNRLKRLTRRPKRHLVDPALAAADHHETSAVLGDRRARLDEMFESAAVTQLRAAADALGLAWRFGHLRSAGGDREVDAVVDLPDGSVIAFEVKLAASVSRADVSRLANLRDQLGESFRAGLLVHPGTIALRSQDRIAAVPLATLV